MWKEGRGRSLKKERIKKEGTPLRSQMGRDILKWKVPKDGVKGDLEEKYQVASGNRKTEF